MEDKSNYICEAFAEYVFGHLNLNFRAWSELAEEIRRFEGDHTRLQQELIKRVRERIFPVCPLFRRQIAAWMLEIEDGLEPTFSAWCRPNEEDSSVQSSKYVFKTYCSDIVLLEENADPMSQGTTGLVSWQGALVLKHWAESVGEHVLRDKRVLELGSGLGLFGMALIKSGIAREFILTDGHEKVLNFLRLNAGLNLSNKKNFDPEDVLRDPEEASEKFSWEFEAANGVLIKILKLDWTGWNEASIPSADIIVASDVVYAPALITPFIETLTVMMMKKGCKMAFVAATKRNGNSIETFLGDLKRFGLSYRVEYRRTFSESEIITTNHEPFSPVTVYKIFPSEPTKL